MAGTEPHVSGTGRMDDITYVGLDVHKATVCVAVAESGPSGEVRQVRVFENRPEILCKIAARLSKGGRRLSFCYEAGPCGYRLHRLLTGCGHSCIVVEPNGTLLNLAMRAALAHPKSEKWCGYWQRSFA